MNKKTFYVTTPIYYPSGNLHIGHVYTTTLAWTLRNYKKLMGFDTKFLTGADEHGQKIQRKAEELNIEPQEYVDKMVESFKDLWEKLHIDYDYFSRTTNKNHEKAVQDQFEKIKEQGDIYMGSYKGLYSVSDEEFITLAQAKEENGKYYHPTSGHELEEVEEESYFFKMGKYQKWLEEYYEAHPNFIVPKKIVNELVSNFLSKGLEDLSISRNTFSWGIAIKENPKHVIYVWLDALNNYITALGYNSDNDADFKKFWENGDEIVHIVGKEITRFHCIYWPIILEAAGLRQPTTILSHGWIITPEGKMSKSKGNVIDPIYLIDKYGHEQVKYFFASQINMGQDGVFDEQAFKETINADLANNFGNLLSRTVAMTVQNFDNGTTHVEPTTEDDKEILEAIELHFNQYKEKFDKYEINKALNEAIHLSKKLNGYIDITKPWTLKEDKIRLNEVLNNLLNGVYAVATMLSVVIPEKVDEALKSLKLGSINFNDITNLNKFDNVKVEKQEPLFIRIK